MKKNMFIFVTNRCNRSCGSCYQQCGNLPQDKIWDITECQLRRAIGFILDNPDLIQGNWVGLIGGEPTSHPRFLRLFDLLQDFTHKLKFKICVNRRRNFFKKNIFFRVDKKRKNGTQHNPGGFIPTLIAPSDITGNEDRAYHFKEATRNCRYYRGCGQIIYDDKLYFCQPAVLFETLLETRKGWELERSSLRKDHTGREEQLIDFCHRCIWSMSDRDQKKHGIRRQSIQKASFVSPINSSLPLKEVRLWQKS